MYMYIKCTAVWLIGRSYIYVHVAYTIDMHLCIYKYTLGPRHANIDIHCNYVHDVYMYMYMTI